MFYDFKEAKKSISFYKNQDDTTQIGAHEIQLEIEKIKRALDENNKMIEKSEWTTESIVIARRAMISGIVLAILFIYCGVTPMISYTATIFQETGSSLSPNMSAIVVGGIQLIGTLVTVTGLADRVERKV